MNRNRKKFLFLVVSSYFKILVYNMPQTTKSCRHKKEASTNCTKNAGNAFHLQLFVNSTSGEQNIH